MDPHPVLYPHSNTFYPPNHSSSHPDHDPLSTPSPPSPSSAFFPLDPPPNLNPDDNPHLEAIRRTNETFRAAAPPPSSVVDGVRRALDSIRTPRLRHPGPTRPKSASSHSLERACSHERSNCPSPRRAPRDRRPSLRPDPGRRLRSTSGTSSASGRASIRSARSGRSASLASTRSSSSASTWWRFWRDSSSSEDATPNRAPPEPRAEFTLVTPSLAHERQSTGPPDEPAPPFDSFTSDTITPALQRLLAFWHEGRQEADVADARSSWPPLHKPTDAPTRVRLPKLRRRALSPMHKLRFGDDGRLSLRDDGQVRAPLAPASAWWLDITCPTAGDMEELRKVFPIHPLSIEDILHQDDREKTETFDGLGYYFVCFRGLVRDGEGVDGEQEVGCEEETELGEGCSKEVMRNRRRRNRKLKTGSGTLVEKDLNDTILDQIPKLARNGIQHVALEVVNLYLVVFRDGVISFHFEGLPKHLGRVKDRMQRLMTTTNTTTTTTTSTTTSTTANSTVNSHMMTTPTTMRRKKTQNERKTTSGSSLGEFISPHWIAYGLMDSIVDDFFPLLELVSDESGLLDSYLADPLRDPEPGQRDRAAERAGMLARITATRRLVVAMSRLMAQKHQTVEALRKRLMVAGGAEGWRMGQSRDIHLYLGDLQDHIVSMSQGLVFHDTLLANAHLAYLGLLRAALGSTKQAQDVLIIRLYLITFLVLPMNTLIGLFSMNIHIPANGDREHHLRKDGSRAPVIVFGCIVVGCFVLGFGVVGVVRWVIGCSERKFGRRFPSLLVK